MKLGMYIMAPVHISTAHFINLSHQSLCLHMYATRIVARQRLGKHVPTSLNTRNNRRVFLNIVSVRSVLYKKESLWIVYLSVTAGSGSVKTFPRQRSIVGGVVFYEVRIVSKERR
jgi:hypothetical protein